MLAEFMKRQTKKLSISSQNKLKLQIRELSGGSYTDLHLAVSHFWHYILLSMFWLETTVGYQLIDVFPLITNSSEREDDKKVFIHKD